MNSSSRTSDQPHLAADDTSTRVAAALEEYLVSVESGQSLTREDFLSRHPTIVDELVPCLDSLEMLYQASLGFDGPHDSTRDENARRLGDFRLIREIGRGGMGVVYEAEQIHLQRRVALKVLPFATLLDETRRTQFNNEARLAAMLKHPQIVSVITVGCDRGVHYYAMELIEGIALSGIIQCIRSASAIPLNDVLEKSTAPSVAASDTRPVASLQTEYSDNRPSYHRRIARIGIQAAEALHFAHQHGVVHRDIKPSNLLLDNEGKLFVSDFGLARIQSDDQLTLSGNVVGTIRYMSPEQAAGRYVNERSDIYSLGVTLYELLTLQPVMSASNRHDLLVEVTTSQTLPARNLDRTIPRDLETILIKATAKESADRYETMSHFADDLNRFLKSLPVEARRQGMLNRSARWGWRNRVGLSAAIFFVSTLCAVLAAGWHREARINREAQEVLDRVHSSARRLMLEHVDAQILRDFSTEQIGELEQLLSDSDSHGRALLFSLSSAYILRSRADWWLGINAGNDPDFHRGVAILQSLSKRRPNDRLVAVTIKRAYWFHAAHLAQDLRANASLVAASHVGDLAAPEAATYGYYLNLAGRLEEAEARGRRACRQLDPQQHTFQKELKTRSLLVGTLLERGNYREASRSLNSLMHNEHEWPESLVIGYWRMAIHSWRAQIDNAHFEAEKAIKHLLPAIEAAHAQLAKFPSHAFYQRSLAQLYVTYSDSLLLVGRPEEAIEALEQALTHLAEIHTAFGDSLRAAVRLRLGQVCRHLDRSEADVHFDVARETTRKLTKTRQDEPYCVRQMLIVEAVASDAATGNPTQETDDPTITRFGAKPVSAWQTDSGHFWRHVALAAYRRRNSEVATIALDRAEQCSQEKDSIDLAIRALVLADQGHIRLATKEYHAALEYMRHGRPVSFQHVGPLFVQSLLDEAAEVLQLEPPQSLALGALK